ncbi:hypothetical protein [Saccharopolyspora pogona]|uniref:hypothetical protein n=1 Tax=Saccharopolyspora pogona TaxID=333966 RepID=UPI0016836AB5|nr:hypothetical protein [Saccharopolyspora pogona]
MLLGKRRGKGFEVARIELHRDLHESVEAVSQAAVGRLLSSKPRVFEAHAALDPTDEYFVLSNAEIEQACRTTSMNATDATPLCAQVQSQAEANFDPSPSALIEELQNPGGLEVLGRAELIDFKPLFYAIAWQQTKGWAVFIRKDNPRILFKPGRRWCKYGDSLKKLEENPVFVFDQTIDAVIFDGQVAGFSPTVLKNLFTDVGLSRAQVPEYIEKASDLIGSEISLSGRSIDSLQAFGKKKVSAAVRLHGLSARIEELRSRKVLTAENFLAVTQSDARARSILNENNEFDFDEEGAEIFLDIIEGRYFEDDWTGVPRRADKFSSRDQGSGAS